MQTSPQAPLDLTDLNDISLELGRIDELANSVSRSLTSAFRGALVHSVSLRSVLSDIARNFADIALKAALKPFGELTGSLVKSIFSATNPVLQGVTPFARGGVVSSPRLFPLAGGAGGAGVGLMGEAGPEAILPLRRGPDGTLGVRAAGQGAPITINFNVTTPDATSFRTAEAEISAMVLRAARRGTRAS